jgi:hypothetical protein
MHVVTLRTRYLSNSCQLVLRQFKVSSDMVSLLQHDCFFVLLLFFLLVITAKPLYVQLEFESPHSSRHHYSSYIVG